MTTAARVRPPRRVISRGPETGSLAGPLVRHLLVLVLTAAAVYLLVGEVPVASQFSIWLGAAVAIGVVAALLARRALGVLFVAIGAAVGLMLHLHLRLGSGEAALAELTDRGAGYGTVVAVAALAYLVTWLVLRYMKRSRQAG